MYSPTATIVPQASYRVGEKPYDVSAAVAAVLADLERQKAKRRAGQPRRKFVDPEIALAKAEVAAARKEAAKFLDEAKEKVKVMTREARKMAEELSRASRQEGFSQGLEAGTHEGYEKGLVKGEEEGFSKYTEGIARWGSLLEEAVREKENYLADRERVLVELVMRVSAKVLAREIVTSHGDIMARIREAVKRANDRSRLVVRVNPEDLAESEEAQKTALGTIQGVKQIEFLADERVLRGGVRIESGAEIIDAGMDTQLTEIIRGLLQEAYHVD